MYVIYIGYLPEESPFGIVESGQRPTVSEPGGADVSGLYNGIRQP